MFVAGEIINYNKDQIQCLGAALDNSGPDSASSRFIGRPLGAIATRLNVHAALYQLVGKLGVQDKECLFQIKKLVWRGEDVNGLNHSKQSPLYVAAKYGNEDAVCLLIEKAADVTLQDASQRSCIHAAAEGGKLKAAKAIAGKVPDEFQLQQFFNSLDNAQKSALHVASEKGYADIAQYLIDNKCEVDIQDCSKKTALHFAALSGSVTTVRTLLQASADINSKDDQNKSPLDFASSNDVIYVLKTVGSNGWTPLMVSAQRNKECFDGILKLVDCFQNHSSTWLQNDLKKLSNLKEHPEKWHWDVDSNDPGYENLHFEAEKMKVVKQGDYPDYSCVVGSMAFDEGIHTWEIRVQNVQSMWVGIAVDAERTCFDRPPGYSLKCTAMIAFYSNDHGCDPFLFAGNGANSNSKEASMRLKNGGEKEGFYLKKRDSVTSFRYTSGQLLGFELDTISKQLKFKINGRLVAVVDNVQQQRFKPFVCMDYFESIELENAVSWTKSSSALELHPDPAIHKNNDDWLEELGCKFLYTSIVHFFLAGIPLTSY
jgi:ankyrin repeat protein